MDHQSSHRAHLPTYCVKVRSISAQLERTFEEKSLVQSELNVKTSEMTMLKTNEKRLVRDCAESRERSKSLEEELQKVHLDKIRKRLVGGNRIQCESLNNSGTYYGWLNQDLFDSVCKIMKM